MLDRLRLKYPRPRRRHAPLSDKKGARYLKSKLYDSGLVSWPCQIVGFDTHPDDTNPMTLERITGVTTDCGGDKCPPTAEPTAEPTAAPKPCPDILKCTSTEDCPDGDGIIYECEFPSVRRNLRFGGYEKTGCCVAV